MTIFYITLLITLAWLSFFIVDENTVSVIERWGKFYRIAKPGLRFKIPIVDTIAQEVDLRLQQHKLEVETKTKDNVFIKLAISAQVKVMPDKVYEATYSLDNPSDQIAAYIFDIIRSMVPGMTLDDLFSDKDSIASSIEKDLIVKMADYGFNIVKILLINIEPDQVVAKAMNEINAAQRERIAAQEKGEAQKILQVKMAEAEAESKKLQGEGIANQRKAIVSGLKESVADFQKEIKGTNPDDVMALLMLTQYFDTLKELGDGNKSKVIFMPHSPSAAKDLMSQLRESLIVSKES